METRLKERLTGAAILVALIVLVVPELFHGQSRESTPGAGSSGEGPPVRSYTIDLSNGPDRTAPLQSTPPATSAPDTGTATATANPATNAAAAAAATANSAPAADLAPTAPARPSAAPSAA